MCIRDRYIIRKIKEEANMDEPIKVVATGGLGSIIAPETDAIDVYDPNLTLDVYKRQGQYRRSTFLRTGKQRKRRTGHRKSFLLLKS